MAILVIAEHDNTALKGATLNTITAAQQIGGDIHLLVAGFNCQPAADAAAKVAGVSKVLQVDNAAYEHQLAENLAKLVLELGRDYSHILAPATTTGKNFMPRVAALLDVAQISDITAVEAADSFQRPIYAGNAIATVKSLDAIKVITVRGTAFEAAEQNGSADISSVDAAEDLAISQFISEEMAKSDRPELTAAKVIISGGRGMGNGENFAMLEQVADKLGAAVGASRGVLGTSPQTVA